ncbi:MAG: hypothetical protein EBS01_06980 [Verrucomicrobia bacterium]|nr:hypothetical protein [Verrucomicrobiota bacterium]
MTLVSDKVLPALKRASLVLRFTPFRVIAFFVEVTRTLKASAESLSTPSDTLKPRGTRAVGFVALVFHEISPADSSTKDPMSEFPSPSFGSTLNAESVIVIPGAVMRIMASIPVRLLTSATRSSVNVVFVSAASSLRDASGLNPLPAV